ncbi:MAG TPA: hypothetical protein VHZ95_06045, partial [Polyangiales bacterium]|nr:hypothetical protein [Polyangiales bacterium]
FGMWWFLKRSKTAANTVATVRQAQPPRPIPPPPAAIPSVPTHNPEPPPPAAPPPVEPGEPPPSAANEDASEVLAEAERDRAAGHDAEAIAAYERAYELTGDPAILSSLAQAEIARGWLTAALDPLQRLLALASTEDARSEVEQKLAELQHRLAHVRLELLHAHGDERIEIDGKVELAAGLGYDVAIDPGDHVMTIARGDRTLDRRDFHAAESELVRLSVELEPSHQ